ncbi:MAG: hypothetical protein ACRDKB_14630 [Actinomycetota bacterium]
MEIDNDLFRLLTLILLGVGVIVLLVIVVTLDKVRKALESRPAPRETAQAAPTHGGLQTEAPAAQVAAEPEPAPSAAAPAAAAQPAAQPAATTPAAEPEPQEQPFERDGRWWYRRGDELLVYDEQAGQWVPAPTPTPGAAAAATGAPAGATAEPQDSGAFWKCPTCGAVNGSTAESCRMCFTPRP